MKQLLLMVVILFAIYSCRKIEAQASDTLMAHTWSPTRTRIVSVDTTTIVTYDSSGETHTVSNSFRKDTTYVLDPCIRNSTYVFSQNGFSQITNACVTGQPLTDTPWAIQPNKVLQIVFIDDTVADVYFSKLFGVPWSASTSSNGFYPVQNGTITQISPSEFVVDQISGENFALTHFVNGQKVDSLVKLTCDRYMTFAAVK